MARWTCITLCTMALPLLALAQGPSRTIPVFFPESDALIVQPLERRAAAKTLSDGTYMQSGSFSSTYRWQSSGILDSGNCPSLGGTMTIRNCNRLYLDRRGMLQTTTQSKSSANASNATTSERLIRRSLLEDKAAADDTKLDLYYQVFPEQAKFRWIAPMVMSGSLWRRQAPACSPPSSTTSGSPTATAAVSPRQRIELLTWPGTTPNQVWTYSWKSYQSSDTKGTYNFFHAWQILRRDGCGGPVITLDYINDKVVLHDIVRGCKACTSMPLKNWVGKTIIHSVKVKYGLSGSITYKAVDAAFPKVTLLSYSVAKGDMGSSASLKFGMYRGVNSALRAATSYYGEFKATKISG